MVESIEVESIETVIIVGAGRVSNQLFSSVRGKRTPYSRKKRGSLRMHGVANAGIPYDMATNGADMGEKDFIAPHLWIAGACFACRSATTPGGGLRHASMIGKRAAGTSGRIHK